MTNQPNKPAAYEIIDAFKATMAEHGVVTDALIIPDGKLHRFHIQGHKTGSLNGAYVLHLDAKPAGYFEDFTTGIKINWKLESYEPQPLAPEYLKQIDQAKSERTKQRLAVEQQAADKAKSMWKTYYYATSSNFYLDRKGIQPHGAKQTFKYTLILPLYSEDKKLVNLQFIDPNGSKRFLRGGRKKGCFWWIGKDITPTIQIAEGFATAASLYEATGHFTVIAYDAGNLEPVAKIIRQRYPNARIVICADNDESGTGQEKANQAALAVNGLVAMPPISGDFNDWAKQLQGGGNG